MHRRLSTLLAALTLAAPLSAHAQTPPNADQPPGSAPASQPPPASPAPAATATPAPPKWYEAVEVHGYADAYYQVRLDAAQTNPAELRSFDDQNGFNVGYAKLSLSMAPSPAGFRIDLGYGRAADKITPRSAAETTSALRYVQQAYAAMKLGIVELDVGRFVTSAGAEVIEAKDNWLYSRSLLFTAIPLTHVGARATATLAEGLTATAGVNNGWDVVTANSPYKTGQFAVTYAKDATSLAATLLAGKQPAAVDYRYLIDAVAQQGFGPLAVNVNFDWFKEGSAKWWGVAGMARYSLPGDVVKITARGEYFDDQSGLVANGLLFPTGTPPPGTTLFASNKLYEGTGGIAVPVGTNSELRLEVRYDKSDEKIFRAGASDHQVTGQIAALGWF